MFDLFDLNEKQSISTIDLEFAIQCIVMSTSKIFNIGADLHEPDVTMLVNKSFNEGVSITLPMLLRWASQTEEVVQFFTLFKMSGPEHIQIKTLTDK